MKKLRFYLSGLLTAFLAVMPVASATDADMIPISSFDVDKITVLQNLTVDPTATLNIREASPTQSGLMSAEHAEQLENLLAPAAASRLRPTVFTLPIN